MRPRSLIAHRSKRAVALGALVAAAAAGACHKDPTVTTRAVTVHVPAACPVDPGAYAVYEPLGDFDPPAAPATGYLLGNVGVALPGADAQTREIVVTVTAESGGTWEGLGAVPASGDVDVLVTPKLASCALTGGVGARAGSAMAPIGGERVLLVGGAVPADAGAGVTPASYVVRLDTGEVDPVAPDLPTARTGASVTAFGDGALVAGGVDLDTGEALADAYVYSPQAGGFTPLSQQGIVEARGKHGAVVLATGQTLLVGGVGQEGKTVLDSLQTVDPTSKEVTESGLGTLSTPRWGPTVLRLASGEILVAGGFDASGAPAQTLEWFLPSGATDPNRKPQTLAQGAGSAFVALEGGGALAVLTPPAGTPECPDACTSTSCGCFQNVWVIDATGAPEPAAIVTAPLTHPVLFGGAGGAPVLWTGNDGIWLQWQPYLAAFVALSVLDDVPATVGDAATSPDPGLAMWLDPATQAVTLLRFDTSNAYSSLPGALLAQDTAATAPDRLAGVSFDPQAGLSLEQGSPGAAAFVTDRTYADVAVDVTAPTGALLVALRDEQGGELDVGGPDCATTLAPGTASTLHVERHGGTVSWSVDGGPLTDCAAGVTPGARLSVGVRAPASVPGLARALGLKRTGAP